MRVVFSEKSQKLVSRLFLTQFLGISTTIYRGLMNTSLHIFTLSSYNIFYFINYDCPPRHHPPAARWPVIALSFAPNSAQNLSTAIIVFGTAILLTVQSNQEKRGEA